MIIRTPSPPFRSRPHWIRVHPVRWQGNWPLSVALGLQSCWTGWRRKRSAHEGRVVGQVSLAMLFDSLHAKSSLRDAPSSQCLRWFAALFTAPHAANKTDAMSGIMILDRQLTVKGAGNRAEGTSEKV
ncbi:hypothetical protein BO86DRAFT_391713 [Aspergillus japonicus CBS 114.51]|uniref:Uncharacterized protein n=1 Tax=Aspergillus japonicus CBS 114.51 TaxID=1448312 RepID=A0A8T8WRZ5_ASPJA|nr:hypothetical protein BO86DRAFT_391713 [Aspergillus japonicus CBS 114.51]RAH78606.1 hypothetical protein BO86DRAFT_391713 [Aspergillus japonicus CBS 114.51]